MSVFVKANRAQSLYERQMAHVLEVLQVAKGRCVDGMFFKGHILYKGRLILNTQGFTIWKKLKPEPSRIWKKSWEPWVDWKKARDRSTALMFKHQLVEFYSFYMCLVHVVETEIVRGITLFVCLFTYLKMLLKLLNLLLVSFLHLSDSWSTPSNLATHVLLFTCIVFCLFTYFSTFVFDMFCIISLFFNGSDGLACSGLPCTQKWTSWLIYRISTHFLFLMLVSSFQLWRFYGMTFFQPPISW